MSTFFAVLSAVAPAIANHPRGISPCGSPEAAAGRRKRAPTPGSPARSASTRCTPPSRRHARGAGLVTFEPGARTAWHTHPLGQTLIIVSGAGWVQSEGGPVGDVRPGDVVGFPPGLIHWRGATPTTAMSHIAITEQLDGKAVDWLEKVSDADYRRS